jgi:TRAP-type uncharacterized transport system fused permease subunit
MLYILPFLFVYRPALLARDMPGFWPMAGLLGEVFAICVLVAGAAQGYLLARLSVRKRVAVAGVALALTLHVCGAWG